uniref:Solute carrier family 5 member 8, like n=1 Tax=Acanthochromis polyacanthus TaxID=80966 RepID=A0A3Q1FAR9_9TELE
FSSQALYTGLVIYAPALALNQSKLKHTEAHRTRVYKIFFCLIYCILSHLLDLFHHSFDTDPLKRHTFWTIVVGGSIMWLSIYSINQSQVQRYISCKTLGHAKMSLYVNMCGLLVTVTLAMLAGLTMYSIYKNCDPISNGDVGSSDQLLPYLVMDMLHIYPGIPGLFVAAAYSGTLSTVSSSINALVAVMVEDFLAPVCKNFTAKQVTWMNMGLSVFFGAVCIGMAGVASAMGNVLQAALSIFGMINGPLLGLFLLGMLFRTSNSIGALSGLITGLALTLWVGIGSQLYPPTAVKTLPLPVNTTGCNRTMESSYTTVTPWSTPETDVSFRPALADTWYSLSYLYFAPFGTLVTIICGLLVSIITGGCKQRHDNPDLFVKKSDLLCFRYCNKSQVRRPAPFVRKSKDGHTSNLNCTRLLINLTLCCQPATGKRLQRKASNRHFHGSRQPGVHRQRRDRQRC